MVLALKIRVDGRSGPGPAMLSPRARKPRGAQGTQAEVECVPGVAAQDSSDARGPEESEAQAAESPGPARGLGEWWVGAAEEGIPRQRPCLLTGPLGINAQHGAWKDMEGGKGQGAVMAGLEELSTRP